MLEASPEVYETYEERGLTLVDALLYSSYGMEYSLPDRIC